MTNILLCKNSIISLISQTNMGKEYKDKIIERLPQMDEGERQELFDTIKNIIFLEIEKEETKKRVKKYLEN